MGIKKFFLFILLCVAKQQKSLNTLIGPVSFIYNNSYTKIKKYTKLLLYS